MCLAVHSDHNNMILNRYVVPRAIESAMRRYPKLWTRWLQVISIGWNVCVSECGQIEPCMFSMSAAGVMLNYEHAQQNIRPSILR